MTRSILVVIILLCVPLTCRSLTYYVNSNQGDDSHSGLSPAQAWKTLDKVNQIIFKPGDRILFRAGTEYAGQLKPQGSGTANNPIRMDKFGKGALPRIDGEGKYEATMELYNDEGWEVSDLEITNLGPTQQPGRKGVYLHLHDYGVAHHLVLKNLFVHDVNGSDLKKSGAGYGIFWDVKGKVKKSRYDGLLIEGCHLVRCDRNGICGAGYWSRQDWFPCLHVVIRNNLLEDIGGDGIVPVACDGCIVEHNVLRGCGKRFPPGDAAAGIWPWSCDNTIVQYNEVSGQSGYWDSQGFDSDWNCRNTIIQYNYSHDNEGGFLLICDDGSVKKPWSVGNVGTIVRYNISINDGYRMKGYAAGFSPTFNISGPVEDTHIYNNTIIMGRKSSPKMDTTLVNMGDWNGWASDTFLSNNIFYTADSMKYKFGSATNTVFDHNLYAGGQVNMPKDEHAIRQNPGLVRIPLKAPAWIKLPELAPKKGSPCIGAGVVIPDNGGKDFLGDTVPMNTPPAIGALEPKR